MIEEVLFVIEPRVTSEINTSLAEPFIAAEVKQAIFAMFPFKSPGPDGCGKEGSSAGGGCPTQAPRVSHLLFADDTLILCGAEEEQIDEIRRILAMYERVSGQMVEMKRWLASRLGVRMVDSHDSYLGLPAIAGRSRRALFQNIRDRFWTRISGWNEKLLSQAGKSVLIKVVLQSLSTYAMSCFRLPHYLINEFESAAAALWWHNRGEKRVHWVAWKKLCHPKKMGGIEFRNMKAFNRALLAKKGWRLLSHSDSLLSKVLKTRYYPNTSFLEASMGTRLSLTWRSILGARDVVAKGCNRQDDGGQNDGSVAWRFWRWLWGAAVPPRVKVLIWKFCYEAVPTMENLSRRRADVETQCALCEAPMESIRHILLECHVAQLVWALSNIP
ncbi:UNVERIFIED_CONTAM: putative mitochondrial protein [Sesamum latifolium]|uniref:Mitochondrial protein n=1 Tax=Sesamum latifolium TaxID=2727402 RepID=A0AAW2XPX3_9LAMI